MRRFAVFIFCLCNVFSFPLTEDYFNDLLDQALDVLRPKIIDEHFNEITVPSFTYSWSKQIWSIRIYGSVGCSEGKVRSLATIYRTGDGTAAVYANGTVTGEAPLGLRALVFEFPKCILRIENVFAVSSAINGEVGKNSIDFKITAIPDSEKFHITLDQIQLKELSNIKLTTGTGIISKLKDEILNGLISKFHGLIFDRIKSALQAYEGKKIVVGKLFSRKYSGHPKQKS